MKSVYIVIASQDYEKANHKGLWDEIANQSQNDVIVLNIPADYVVTLLKRRNSRIKDAKKGITQVSDYLYELRPLYFARPEILPKILFTYISKQFWHCIEKNYPNIFENQINIITYDALWVSILKDTKKNLKIAYYLFDEVRYKASNNKKDKKKYFYDAIACKKSDIIFAMTKILRDTRLEYNKNITVLGNGANIYNTENDYNIKFTKSIAFVGNFRDWIDKNLLSELIKNRRDITFAFVGPIEDNMKVYFQNLLNNNLNTIYLGCVNKQSIGKVYQMFDGIIIPYIDNSFIRATRPIKIVEAVLSGVPVITVPVNGYEESDFIRFATNVDEFSNQINYILQHPIEQNDLDYIKFIKQNTWEEKARIIIDSFK